MGRLRSFAAFWYDFLIGDDWRVAVAVAVAFAAVWATSRAKVTSWWIVPVAVAVVLPFTLWRAVASRR